MSAASADVASAANVKKLRELSGAPLMDCKNALLNPTVQGDLQKAVDWLRAKGISKVSKSTRETKEGLIGLSYSSPVSVQLYLIQTPLSSSLSPKLVTIPEPRHNSY